MARRREFRFQEGGANKFWAIQVAGKSFTVQFGRLGATGQTQTKGFGSAAEAAAAAAKLIAEKIKKGYQEIGTGQAAPAGPSPASETVHNCKTDRTRLGVLGKCMRPGASRGSDEWPGQYLSTRTIAYSCGILARAGDPVVHAHDAEELKRCGRFATEAAGIVKGVLIGMGDEGDHTLDPFWIPANVGDPVPNKITEDVFRTAMRGTVYPDAVLTIEPFKTTSDWWKRVSAFHPDYRDVPEDFPNEPARVARWKCLFEWFRGHPDLRAPAYIGFERPRPQRRGQFVEAFAAVYPKLFLALTASGSLVGLVTCVVRT
jgi:predicted DNA-binding WGR domain protein